MPFFTTAGMASNTIQHSNLVAGGDVNVNVISNTHNVYEAQKPDPMVALQEQVAFGAFHDSSERFDAPKCHPETRTAVLNLIDQWAKNLSGDAQPVFWLTGAAGAGKSAIAQTLVEKWKQEDLLVLCFFFWRTSSERNQKTKLVPTLSYQLSEHCPSAKAVIKEAIGSGDIFKKKLEVQLQELLLRPLEKVATNHQPVIVVVDGLDECCANLPSSNDFCGQDFAAQQREILDVVASACQKVHTARFLICSRPEQVIRESFRTPRLQKFTHQLSLNDAPNVDGDIKLFLQCELEEVRRRYPSLPSEWPGEDRLSSLVWRSSGQFIYPSTVVKYIIHRRQHPDKSLQDILCLDTQSKNTDIHPLSELDKLYTLILKSVPAESLDTVRMILGILSYLTLDNMGCSYNALSADCEVAQSPHALEKLLFLSEGEVFAHLSDLHSILYIPPAEEPHDTIRITHATLSEFLEDESRSKDLHIPSDSLHFNLCLLMFRHLTADKREANSTLDKAPEDKIGLYYYLSYCPGHRFVDIPLGSSTKLKAVMWDFLKEEIGSYTSLITNLKLNLKFGVDVHDCSACGQAHYVDLPFKVAIVDYLLESNTPASEPQPLRRLLVSRRLTKVKKLLESRIETLREEYNRRRDHSHF